MEIVQLDTCYQISIQLEPQNVSCVNPCIKELYAQNRFYGGICTIRTLINDFFCAFWFSSFKKMALNFSIKILFLVDHIITWFHKSTFEFQNICIQRVLSRN